MDEKLPERGKLKSPEMSDEVCSPKASKLDLFDDGRVGGGEMSATVESRNPADGSNWSEADARLR
jgi:hypothetical protein